MNSVYKNKQILITGGLGFIGSSLAIKLVELGANVTIVDVLWPEHGGNIFNIEPIKKHVQVNICDIRDKHALAVLVKNKNYIFHLAGQCSHVLGQVDPYPDIDINIHGTAILIEAIKHYNPDAVTVYTSTRGVYGSVKNLPVDENCPTNPKGLYELSNLTAEKILKFYWDEHGIKIINLRLSNIYGERSQMRHDKFGVVNWFIRQAMEGKTIKIFGSGNTLRDFLYISDCIEAMIKITAAENAYGNTFNVGNDQSCKMIDLVKTILDLAKNGTMEFTSFTRERLTQEPGDFYPDISKIKGIISWKPKTTLQEGLLKTLAYYSTYKDNYW